MKTRGFSTPHGGRKAIALSIHVQFGSPLKNCLHFGICRVEMATAAASDNPCKSCMATARIEPWEGKGIVLSFLKESMKPAVRERHFAGNMFTVEDAYTLPEAVASAIDMAGFTIEPGNYPVLETGKYLKVIFA